MIDLRTADLPDLPGAICAQVGPELWFGDEPGDRGRAIAACRMRPARAACLAWALDHNVDGVWGGVTEGQRRKLRHDRKHAA